MSAAALLRSLHRPGDPLLLPNAWDAASAGLIRSRGFPVIATTSSGVAASLGFADGEQVTPAEMFAAVRRIAAAVDLPVTADIESGYGLMAADLVPALTGAGAVGCNLEDSDHARPGDLRDPDEQAERIAAVKQAAGSLGVDIVLNARVDVFLRGGSLDEGITRARRYVEAGADCVFPIMLSDRDAIRQFVGAVDAPVNVLRSESTPPVSELARIGVARISFGGGLMRVAMDAAAAALDQLLGETH